MQAQSQFPEQLRPVRAVFRAVVETVLPEAAQFSAQDWDATERLVGETLGRRSRSEIRQLRLFLSFIQWAPLFRFGARFTSLDAAHRRRVLERLQNDPVQLIRAGFWGLRTLAFLAYYGRPEISNALGYVPDARGWEVRR